MTAQTESSSGSSFARNAVAFVIFAVAASLLNAVLYPGFAEQPYAEGFGRAAAAWGLAYLLTWKSRVRRHIWLSVVAVCLLVLMMSVDVANV